MVAQTKEMLNLLGVGVRRLQLVEVPLGDGSFLAKQINSFVRRVEKLGPSPIKLPETNSGEGELF
ncbi:MAG: hypothetical protein COS88_06170 [Chloroflexi bacterium CG07_land_8_20_14_0_80_51_10]|nr:MAG: hypothetical protein COS88_06170 [Chloroflexi bacterium CG07_land_8_20_14_0_80_51_10]